MSCIPATTLYETRTRVIATEIWETTTYTRRGQAILSSEKILTRTTITSLILDQTIPGHCPSAMITSSSSSSSSIPKTTIPSSSLTATLTSISTSTSVSIDLPEPTTLSLSENNQPAELSSSTEPSEPLTITRTLTSYTRPSTSSSSASSWSSNITNLSSSSQKTVKKGLSPGSIAGIIIGVLVVIFLITTFIQYRRYVKSRGGSWVEQSSYSKSRKYDDDDDDDDDDDEGENGDNTWIRNAGKAGKGVKGRAQEGDLRFDEKSEFRFGGSYYPISARRRGMELDHPHFTDVPNQNQNYHQSREYGKWEDEIGVSIKKPYPALNRSKSIYGNPDHKLYPYSQNTPLPRPSSNPFKPLHTPRTSFVFSASASMLTSTSELYHKIEKSPISPLRSSPDLRPRHPGKVGRKPPKLELSDDVKASSLWMDEITIVHSDSTMDDTVTVSKSVEGEVSGSHHLKGRDTRDMREMGVGEESVYGGLQNVA